MFDGLSRELNQLKLALQVMGILEKLMYFGIKMPSRQEHRDVFNRYLLAYAVCQILSTGWRKSSKYTQLKLPILCLLGEISQFIFLILQSRKPDPEEENDMPKRPLYLGSARAFFFFFILILPCMTPVQHWVWCLSGQSLIKEMKYFDSDTVKSYVIYNKFCFKVLN